MKCLLRRLFAGWGRSNRRHAAHTLARRGRLAVEALEEREVPAAPVQIDVLQGVMGRFEKVAVLQIWATTDSDTIVQVDSTQDSIIVKAVSGQMPNAPPTVIPILWGGYVQVPGAGMRKLLKIEFHGGKGNDVFTNNTAVNCVAFGDDGNDVLTGGFGDNSLYGMQGDDVLVARGPQLNVLYGGWGPHSTDLPSGHDTFVGGGGGDYTPNEDTLLSGMPFDRPLGLIAQSLLGR